MAEHLTQARLASERGDHAAALAGLLAVWRELPTNDVAESIERVSLQLPGEQEVTEESWLEVAKGNDAVQLPGLLAQLARPRQSPKLPTSWLVAWIEAGGPRDPRLSKTALSLLRRPPWTGSRGTAFWQHLFELLAVNGDPNCVPALEQLDFPRVWESMGSFAGQATMRRLGRQRDTCIAALKSQFPTSPALPPDAAAELERLTAVVRRGEDWVEQLTRAVLAEPHRADLRSVLRDALLETGAPRGRVMLLDEIETLRPLSGDESAERADLIQRFGPLWAGSVAQAVEAPSCRYRDGFLIRGRLAWQEHLVEPTLGDPHWATVETLDVFHHSRRDDFDLVLQLIREPIMRSLRGLLSVTDELLPALWGSKPTWLRELGLRLSWNEIWQDRDTSQAKRIGDEPRHLSFFEDTTAAPHLTRLDLSWSRYQRAPDYRRLWSTPLVARLETLRVHPGRSPLADWHAELSGDNCSHLHTIELGAHDEPNRFELHRDGDGRLSQLRLLLPANPREKPRLKALLAEVAGLPPRALTSLRISGRSLDTKNQKLVKKALEAQAGCEIVL